MPVRLIVRRVKPAPGSQLALFATYSYHGFITHRDGETLELEADHRRHAEIENAIRDLKYGVGLNHLPSGRFAANGAWLAVQTMAHNLARWTARIGLGERIVTTKTLRRRVFALARADHPLGTPPDPASSTGLALGGEVQPRPGTVARPATPSLTAPVRQCPNVPANSRQSGPRAPLTVSYPAISLTTATVGRHRHPQKRLQTAADPASTRIRARTIRVCYFLSPLPVSSPRPSLSIGGFGLTLVAVSFLTVQTGSSTAKTSDGVISSTAKFPIIGKA